MIKCFLSQEKSLPVYDSYDIQHPFIDEIRDLFKYRSLIRELISCTIKARYKRSVFGVAWTMLNPLITMFVLNIVFSQLFTFSIPKYPVYLLSGLLLWNFFSQTTVASMNDLVWSNGILNRIFIPRSLFAVSAIGTGIINLLLALIPLGIIILFNGVKLRLSLLFLPVSILLISAFALGIGLAFSTLAVFFTDVVDMYQILLLAWMYLTPTFYPLDIVAPEYRWIININPMYYLLECFRSPIYLGELPEKNILSWAIIASVLSLGIGSLIFVNKSRKFTYYL